MPFASKELIESPQVCCICDCLLEHVQYFDTNLNTYVKGYYSIFIRNVNYFICKKHYDKWNIEMVKLFRDFLEKHKVSG